MLFVRLQWQKYKDEILNLCWHGKNIAEILEMTIKRRLIFLF